MEEFRALLGTKQVVTTGRPRADGAGGHGVYNGRSGRFLGRKVRDRHRMVVMLAVCGWTNQEIATAMHYTPSRVSIILSSKHPELLHLRQQTLERVANSTVDLTAKIRLAAPAALERMIDIVQSVDEAQARLAARDILDRAGYSPVKKQLTVEAQLPVDQLSDVLGRIQEANEVVLQQDNWAVKTFPRRSQRDQGAA
jgi:predicted transcriptional regulator